ncbi:unnamed protein product [Nesidiocoris tenuis]|uniref:Uncharacterized protein n=1 Tax=Nesidiocoris tenuis TaxID=355587 RepID=A0A6H5GTC3_9HEMI|nr:unnamed protein product [Nesidiocoris tenuis]
MAFDKLFCQALLDSQHISSLQPSRVQAGFLSPDSQTRDRMAATLEQSISVWSDSKAVRADESAGSYQQCRVQPRSLQSRSESNSHHRDKGIPDEHLPQSNRAVPVGTIPRRARRAMAHKRLRNPSRRRAPHKSWDRPHTSKSPS